MSKKRKIEDLPCDDSINLSDTHKHMASSLIEETDKDNNDVPITEYVSPISNPLLSGKLHKNALNLLQKVVIQYEKKKNTAGDDDGITLKSIIRRGIAEVTKSIRKGFKGIVFIAADVYPIDIVSHFPVYCENKQILYCFLGTKKELGLACGTKRPTSVIMILEPLTDVSYYESYAKFSTKLKKVHPYF